MDFEVDRIRGPPQVVRRVDKTDVLLHDPLLVTVLDFDRRALDQLAHGLYLAVTYAYNHAPGISKKRFFVNQSGKPVNPSQSEGGNDVYCLLKHIQENAETYSKLLNKDVDEIEETSKFLREKIRNAMAHQTYLNCPGLSDPNSNSSCVLDKTQTTEKCLDECAKLLQWVVSADFYRNIREEVTKVLQNIKNMKSPVFEDFKQVKQSITARQANDLNTQKAKRLLQNLLQELENEDRDDTTDDRPVTHLINMVLAPRIKKRELKTPYKKALHHHMIQRRHNNRSLGKPKSLLM